MSDIKNAESTGEGLKDEILDNPDLLEDANYAFFDTFETDPILEKEDKVYNKVLFEDSVEKEKSFQAILVKQAALEAKLGSSFDKYKRNYDPFQTEEDLFGVKEKPATATTTTTTPERTSAFSTRPSTTSTPATSQSRYPSSSTTTAAASSKNLFSAIEERSVKITERASKAAVSLYDSEQKALQGRRKKPSFMERMLPSGSKKKKAAIIASVILVEAAISTLLFVQTIAKTEFYRRLGEETWD
jgi:hypothetical protein